jgi:MFS transporter, DHA1 family, purine ribonucleoside efflux pump
MTDTTSQFDSALIDIDAAEPAAWSAATWFAVLSMAATSFALVSAEFLPAGLLTPMALVRERPDRSSPPPLPLAP